MFSGSSEVGIETFELKPSLWQLITSVCPSNETDEIKRILGASLVEQACDLYEEANTLLDIWRIARDDTDTEINERQISAARLPEPPNMRERLLQEIHFFIDYLKEKNSSSKNGPLHRSSSSENILEYVTKTRVKKMEESSGRSMSRGSSGSGGSSRPMSGVSSRDGRETPLRVVTPSNQSDGGSQWSMLSDKVEGIDEHVNATDIDHVVEHLRQVLSEECDERRSDIAFLHKCLDEEQEYRASVNKPEPTLKELREFGSQLEKEVLESSNFIPAPTITSPTNPRPPLLPALPHPPPAQSYKKRVFNRASKVKRNTSSQFDDHNISHSASSPQSKRSVVSAQNETHTSLNSPCTRQCDTCRGSSAPVYTRMPINHESMCTVDSNTNRTSDVQTECTLKFVSSYGKPIT